VNATRRQLSASLRDLEGVIESESMFGHGLAYWANGKEIAHFDSDEEFEVRLTRSVIRSRRAELASDSRVAFRRSSSDWLTVRLGTQNDDVDFVIALVTIAEHAHRPPPGTAAKQPPTGPDLERRRRFH
jgi:hypothetical protein